MRLSQRSQLRVPGGGIPAGGSMLMAAGELSARGPPDGLQAGMVEALKRPRGIIPEGLDYFSLNNFKQRCHQILPQVLKFRKVGGSGI